MPTLSPHLFITSMDADFHNQLTDLLADLARAQEQRRREQHGKLFIAALKTLMVWFIIVVTLFFGHRALMLDWEFWRALLVVLGLVVTSAGGMVFLVWLVSGGRLFDMLAEEFKPLPKGYHRK